MLFYCFLLGQFSSLGNAHSAQSSKLSIGDIRQKRLDIFNQELKRQQSLISRLEKIEVNYQGFNDETVTLIMNKGVSTPYNCAQRKCEQQGKHSCFDEIT